MSVRLASADAPPLPMAARIAVGALAAAATLSLALTAQPGADQPSTSPDPMAAASCSAEDVVPVRLAEATYGMAAGTLACVHVDYLEVTP